MKNHKEPVSEDAVGGVCVCQLADVGVWSPSSHGEGRQALFSLMHTFQRYMTLRVVRDASGLKETYVHIISLV